MKRLRVLDGAHGGDDLLEDVVHLDDGGSIVARVERSSSTRALVAWRETVREAHFGHGVPGGGPRLRRAPAPSWHPTQTRQFAVILAIGPVYSTYVNLRDRKSEFNTVLIVQYITITQPENYNQQIQ